MQREPMLDRLKAGGTFDVLVVGGGATGLGAAVEAATRGHRVALIEQDDFAKGTSSRATKLVHGGVRYLKQRNISLVRDALRERGRLLRNAPHLTRNLAFVIPNYSRRDAFFYGTGLTMYDWLAGEMSLGASRRVGRDETLRLLPTIEPKGLVGGVVYHDGQFDDSRLAVNLAQTAADHGAVVVNRCACVGLVKDGGRVAGAKVRDGESGAEFEVRAKVVVNATGIFVDALRRLDAVESRPLVTVSQGVHVVLPKSFLPGEAAMMIPKTADGRVLFAVPWQECVIVGTTDTPRPATELEPRALQEECDFVMEHAGKYLTKDPSPADVLSVFAGLRPLVKAGGGNTAKLSRDHTILTAESGLVTITGGKWTTYRKMGEDVINHAEAMAGLVARRSVTADLKIHGWQDGVETTDTLAAYGADAEGIRALMREQPELADKLHPAFACVRAEVVWHARHEMARTIEDVLARRTRALLLNARASIEAAPAVAALLAGELGRDENWQREQVAAYTTLAKGYVFTEPTSRRQTG
jgi:glycerol-3-phosphate dehydrogenase